MKTLEQGTESREMILREALREIQLKGFQAANINKLAERTGMTKGALYYHFTDKRELGLAVYDELISEDIDSSWVNPLKECDDVIECLNELIREIGVRDRSREPQVGFASLNLPLEMSPLDQEFRKRSRKMYRRAFNALKGAITRSITNGHLKADLDPSLEAKAIMMMVSGGMMSVRTQQSKNAFKEHFDVVSDYLERLRP